MTDAWELVSERPGGTVSSIVACNTDVVAVSTAAVHRSIDAGATWSTLSAGRLRPPLTAIIQSGASVFVAGQGGLARSGDLGRSWNAVLTGDSVLCLGVIPQTSGPTLLAGTQGNGLLRSEDNGNTWASANPGLLDSTVLSVAAAPAGVSLAGTDSGLYRSTNAGRSWREISLPCGPVGVECLAASDKVVLAGTDSAGTYVSLDTGRTWSPVAGLGEFAATAAAIGLDGALLAVGSPSGVFISRDRGHTWTFEAIGCVLSMACVADSVLAGLASDGILRLRLATNEWQQSSAGLSGRLIVHFGWSEAGALLTADLDAGVQRSIDGGRTWETADRTPSAASRLAVAGGAVYAATTSGLYASDDDGLTWSEVDSHTGAYALAAATSGHVLVGFEDSQLLLLARSRRRVLEWSASRGRIVAVALADEENLFVGALGERTVVWRSTDGGENWTSWFCCDRGDSMCVAVSPEFAIDRQVLIGVDTRVFRPLRRTRERTRSGVRPLWSATSLPDAVTSIAYGVNSTTVYVATSRGVQRSVDGAEHFTPWSAGLPSDTPVLAIQSTPRAVYALGFGGTLWRRPDDRP